MSKVENNAAKVPKQSKAKRDGVINPQNYNFKQFWYGTFRCSQNATNQPKSTAELDYMCPQGLIEPLAVTLTTLWFFEKSWNKWMYSKPPTEPFGSYATRYNSRINWGTGFFLCPIFRIPRLNANCKHSRNGLLRHELSPGMNCRRRQFMPMLAAWIVAGDNLCRCLRHELSPAWIVAGTGDNSCRCSRHKLSPEVFCI